MRSRGLSGLHTAVLPRSLLSLATPDGPPSPAAKAGVEQSCPPHQGHPCHQEDPHPCWSSPLPSRTPLSASSTRKAFPNDFCLRRKDAPSPECPTYIIWFSPSLGHLADGRSRAGPYLLLLDPRALSLGSGETGGRYLFLQHGLTPALMVCGAELRSLWTVLPQAAPALAGPDHSLHRAWHPPWPLAPWVG